MFSIRDKLGYALSLKWVKSIVLMIFTAYLVVAIWGITSLKEGLEKRNTVNFDSYSIPFFDADDKYYMVRNICEQGQSKRPILDEQTSKTCSLKE